MIARAVAGLERRFARRGSSPGAGSPRTRDESPPADGAARVRITEGVGSSADYGPRSRHTPRRRPVLTEIADGKTVLMTMPRGPAPELTWR